MVPELNVPQTVQLLSVLTRDVSSYCVPDAIIPGRREPHDGKFPEFRKLLNALAFFLRVTPKGGKVFAITMTIGSHEAVAALSANTIEDVNSSDNSSPKIILGAIWDHLVQLATDMETSGEPVTSDEKQNRFATYLISTHSQLLEHRLRKRSKAYEKFRRAFMELRDAPGVPLGSVNDYLEKVHMIYTTTQKYVEELKKRKGSALEQVVSLFVNTILTSVEDLGTPTAFEASEISRIREVAQIKGKSAPSLLAMVALTLPEEFNLDIVRYVDKLCAPFFHLTSFVECVEDTTFRTHFKPKLRIQIVEPASSLDTEPIPPAYHHSEVIRNYIREAYQSSRHKQNLDAVNTVIDSMANEGAICLREGSAFAITAPHCECSLIQHHHNNPGDSYDKPIYIGVSKLSCFQCGIFLDAYNAFAKDPERYLPTFSIAGRHNHVYPSRVPIITSADTFIATDMKQTIRHVIEVIVNKKVSDSRARTLSESSSGSAPDLAALTKTLRWFPLTPSE